MLGFIPSLLRYAGCPPETAASSVSHVDRAHLGDVGLTTKCLTDRTSSRIESLPFASWRTYHRRQEETLMIIRHVLAASTALGASLIVLSLTSAPAHAVNVNTINNVGSITLDGIPNS